MSKPGFCNQIILCSCPACASGPTHHINGVNVGELGEELTAAEGELGVGLEELLSGETKPDTRTTQLATGWQRGETKAAV